MFLVEGPTVVQDAGSYLGISGYPILFPPKPVLVSHLPLSIRYHDSHHSALDGIVLFASAFHVDCPTTITVGEGAIANAPEQRRLVRYAQPLRVRAATTPRLRLFNDGGRWRVCRLSKATTADQAEEANDNRFVENGHNVERNGAANGRKQRR
jgi:hypothetical protein